MRGGTIERATSDSELLEGGEKNRGGDGWIEIIETGRRKTIGGRGRQDTGDNALGREMTLLQRGDSRKPLNLDEKLFKALIPG